MTLYSMIHCTLLFIWLKGYGDIEEDSSLFNDVIFSSFNVALMSIVSALLAWFTSNKGTEIHLLNGNWNYLKCVCFYVIMHLYTHYQISLSLFVLFLGKMLLRYLVNLSIDFFFFSFLFCKITIFENFLVTFASKLSWTTDMSFIHGTHCIVTVL